MFAWRDQYLSYNGAGGGGGGDPYWTYVSLLENFEIPQTSFTDTSADNCAVTVVGTVNPNYRTPFSGSGASIKFNGTDGYLSYTNTNSGFTFGTNSFTVECWAYFNSLPGSLAELFNVNTQASSAGYAAIRVTATSGGALYFLCSANAGTWINTSTTAGGTVTTNTWYHIAVTRSGSTFRSFVNGVVDRTFTSSAVIFTDATIPYNIGRVAYLSGTFFFNGYMDDYRVTKGYARYTAAFTPPTAALPGG
jgi:hypothetical protein